MTKKNAKLIFVILFLTWVVLGCVSSNCIKPQIIKDTIGIKKERIDDITDAKMFVRYVSASQHDKNKATGFFKRKNENISIVVGQEKPYLIKCIDSMGNNMWSRSLGVIAPGMGVKSSVVYEGKTESLVILLIEGSGTDAILKILVLSEDGNVKMITNLQGSGGIFGKYILRINVLSINDEPYIIAMGDRGIAIHNFKGERITYLNTKAVTREATCMEFNRRNNKYIAIYADHRSIARSSTLFILNDKFELLYEEVLPSNGVSSMMWMGIKHFEYDDDLIVAAGEIYECTKVGSPIVWKYSFKEE